MFFFAATGFVFSEVISLGRFSGPFRYERATIKLALYKKIPRRVNLICIKGGI